MSVALCFDSCKGTYGARVLDTMGNMASVRGRPRDAAIDERILAAAAVVYAERGWSGFNFDVIARRAEVSKDAVYRRHRSPLDLLIASLGDTSNSQHRERALPDDASVRDFLLAVAGDHFEMYTFESGFDYLRLYVEAGRNPEPLESFYKEVSEQNVKRVRQRVRQSMQAGELPDAHSPTAVIDAVLGAVVLHVMATPHRLRTKMVDESVTYLTELVDMVLRGCGYRAGSGGAGAKQ